MLTSLVLICFSLDPVPDKLVVLTFDDASKSHYTVVRPLLKRFGFGATFFVTEGFDFPTNKRDYMTWKEIAELHRDGFEIGNHTKDHLAIEPKTLRRLDEQLRGIEDRCKEFGIAKPTSFAYPGNGIDPKAFAILKEHGIVFARRGGAPEHEYKDGKGFAYQPGLDHPLLIPSAGDARPTWTIDDFKRAVDQAKHGKIAVLQFHGVPDTAHNWVNLVPNRFEQFLRYLKDNKFKVIALRDLAKYVDPAVTPSNAWGVIEDRKQQLKSGKPTVEGRKPRDQEDLKYWLRIMRQHEYSMEEMSTALDMPIELFKPILDELGELKAAAPPGQVAIAPYPGGRHPRTGFLDGAIRPQRETKVSVFPPWKDGGYAVADVPEAVWFTPQNQRELLYLAHTHVPTFWDKQGVFLPAIEWQQTKDVGLSFRRNFPNNVIMNSSVRADKTGVRMQFVIKNESDTPITGLSAQMCVMLKGLKGFEECTNDNKIFSSPFSACKDRSGKRWIITAWENCGRAWGNPPCPCLHSDPKLHDCAPGRSVTVQGWISFFEGSDIQREIERLRTTSPFIKN